MPDPWQPKTFEPDKWAPSTFTPDSGSAAEEDNFIIGKAKKLGNDIVNKVRHPIDTGFLNDLVFGPDKTPSGRKIIGKPSDTSLLPEIKHEPETYSGGVAKSLYDNFVRPAVSESGVFSSIAGGIKRIPRIDPAKIEEMLAAGKAANKLAGFAQDERLALPPKGETGKTFYNGPSGTTQSDKLYPIDTAPQTPRIGQTDAGTILPRETEGLSNLDPITAANRGTKLGDIQSIDKSSPAGVLRSLEKVKSGEPIKMPVRDDQIGDITGGQGNIGDPSLPYQTESAVRKGKFKPQTFVPDTPENGSTIGSTELKSTAIEKVSKQNNTKGVPTPGQAVSNGLDDTGTTQHSKDINLFRAEFGSVDKTLSSRPDTKPIAEGIIGAADQKAKWIATTERQLAEITKGLSKGDLITLGDAVDKGIAAHGTSPDLINRARLIKAEMDKIHSELKLPEGMNIGYIKNYLAHIDKLPEDDLKNGIKQIWEYHIGKPFKDIFTSNELGVEGNGVKDYYEKGLGNPDSPFRKPRGVGSDDIELNINKVLPAYIESIARLKFDRPAVDLAKQTLASLSDKDIYGEPSKLKELAGWYIKNYTRYDAMPGLTAGWNDFTNKVMRTTGRSMLGFSTGLQTLHLARIPANLWPELGTKYTLEGIKQLVANPKAAYQEAASLGLLQNEVRPWNFKTPMQKVDSILSFFTAADFLDRSIGYHGFKKMFMDQGLDETKASAQALAKSKDVSLLVDAARPIKSFNPEGGPAGSAWRLATQFKQVPIKIIEQYAGIVAKAKQDPKTAARMVAGVGLAVAASEAGLHTFHISPKQAAIQMGGAVGTVVNSVVRDLAKGDIVSALKKTTLWLTPGGMSVERQLRKGLSAFESDDVKH